MSTESIRTRRSPEEMVALSLQVAEFVYSRIKNSTPPMRKEVAHRFGIAEIQVRRLVDTFDEHWRAEYPEVFVTFRNWTRSHKATSYEQQSFAVLAKDMLESPGTFGALTLNDMAASMGIPPALLGMYYERWKQKGWPPLPPKASGWINTEAASACILGDIEKLKELNTTEDELLAMRHELIEQRLTRFVWKDKPAQLC